MKRKTNTNILLALLSCALVLGLAEITMRFAWEMAGWRRIPIYRRTFNDPYLRYELMPNSQYGAYTTINASGFRGPDYPVEKPAKTFRIIMLGDSETLSIALPETQTLAAQLESLLNKNSSGYNYQVFNFGVEGYGTQQELEQLKSKGLKYKPDLVILNYCLNDPDPGEYYFSKTFLMRHSALARYFTFRIRKALIKRERRRLGIRTEIEHFYYYHQPKYFIPIQEAILEIADTAKKAGGKLALIIFPTSSIAVKEFGEKYPYRQIHNQLKSIKSDNIIFIDLIDEFERLSMGPQEVSINYRVNESHKNALALKVSADYIYRILKSQKICNSSALGSLFR